MEPAWLRSHLSLKLRWEAMARLALSMALHDSQRALGAISGIAFAFLLVAQSQIAIGFYLEQGTAFIDNAGVDLWIVPPATKMFGGGPLISASSVSHARVCPGVAWAEPLIVGGTSIRLPDGGAEALTLIGTSGPNFHGGPYNIVAGSANALLDPNTVLFEDFDREKTGGLNLGDYVELNHHRVRVGGFTWGVRILGNPFAFAELDFAQQLLGIDSDRVSYVLVGLEPGADPVRVARDLRERASDGIVISSQEFRETSVRSILVDRGVGGFLVMGALIGFTVGLSIVGLSMTASVQKHEREFGTLKALGATNGDLRRILLLHGLSYSLIGSFGGAALMCMLASSSRSGALNMIVEPNTLCKVAAFVTVITMISAMLAVRRVTKLDPASVFR
jgi:putative ABC transport system permease protein